MYRFLTFSLFISLSNASQLTPDTALLVTSIYEFRDSSKWHLIDKKISAYDDKQRLFFETIFSFDGPVKNIWNYNPKSSEVEKIQLIQSELADDWKFVNRDISHNHRLIDTTINQYHHDNKTWINQERTISIYSPSGLISEKTRFRWENKWVNNYKHTYEYNTNNTLKKYLLEEWNGATSAWLYNFREIYEYDTNHQKIKMTVENFRENEWKLCKNVTFNYAKISSILITEMNVKMVKNDSLVNYMLSYDTTYSSGKLKGSVSYEWNNKAWMPSINKIYTYDFMGNLVMMQTQQYDKSQWVDTERNRREYVYSKNLAILQQSASDSKNGIKISQTKNEITISGLKEISEMVVFQILDLDGQLVYSKELKAENQNVLTFAKTGINYSETFILQLKDGSGKICYRKKFVNVN
jgi:hypothetical protein